VEETMYEALGGEAFFVDLVDGFYQGVENNEILRPMYPEDLTDAKRHLVLFLVQYWGGPRTYLEERGHPRLRMRHAEFTINKRAREAWLTAMMNSLTGLKARMTEEQFTEMSEYFSMSAMQLRNA
jgi:hemoglobin